MSIRREEKLCSVVTLMIQASIGMYTVHQSTRIGPDFEDVRKCFLKSTISLFTAHFIYRICNL